MKTQETAPRETPRGPLQPEFAENGLPPYHLFENSGEQFVYFVERDCSFRVDEPAFQLLQCALECPLDEAASRLAGRNGYREQVIRDVTKEAKRLEAAGFFRAPRNRLSQAAKEKALTQRYATPWTRLELALAESCNLACKYCYCSAVRDMPNQGLMSEEVARKAIDWLFKVSGDSKDLSLTLFGGEPLLNKPVFKFVMDYSDALAKQHGKRVYYSMTTNGTLIDDMVIHYIKKHNFGLMVSLDGPPEVHDKQCPTQDGGPSFELAAAGIKRLMRRRRRVTVRCTLTKHAPRLMELVGFFDDFGFTRIVLGPARNPIAETHVDCGREALDRFAREKEEDLIPWMLSELEKGRVPAWFPYSGVVSRPADTRPKPLSMFRCGACRGTSTVGADGRLYPCHRFVGMQNWVLGHIDEGPDIEFAKSFWRRYDDAVDGNCSRCWARRGCNRPCPWQIAQEDGSFETYDEDYCAELRRMHEDSHSMQWHIQTHYPDVYARLSGRATNPRNTDQEMEAAAP